MASTGRTTIVVDGVRKSFLEVGPPSEEAAVFVHGNAGGAETWQELMDAVATSLRCIAPEMRGYGETDKPADFEYRLDGYAHHLAGIVDALDVRSVHLICDDLGGAWALAWAATSRIGSRAWRRWPSGRCRVSLAAVRASVPDTGRRRARALCGDAFVRRPRPAPRDSHEPPARSRDG
jgi:pimeloyl-ACP methyl ester carboxylesterase